MKTFVKAVLSMSLMASAALVSVSTLAADCSIDITSNDAMQFSTKEILISKSCEKFTINLEHTGKLPKTVMGHNVVITKTDDVTEIVNASIKVGAAGGYLVKDDERVIAETSLIGGGEKTTAEVDVSKLAADQNYTFFCSFPGHNGVMRGVVKLVD